MSKHYIWSTLQQFGSIAIGFGGTILIARLLNPTDYGLVAALSIFMSIAMNLTESGLADFLIS